MVSKESGFPTIYIPICDESLWVLKIYSYLFKKFWGEEQKVVIMGFKKPDFDLPQNFDFISLAEKQEGGATKWTRYIHDYLITVDDEYVIFSLEDFLPIEKPNEKILSDLFEFTKSDVSIGRCDITWDSFINVFDRNNKEKTKGTYAALRKNKDYTTLQIPKNAPYRISTQPAIWRKDYLLKFLNNDWSPWQFEVLGTQVSCTLPDKVIAGADTNFVNYATKWVHKGAVSRYHEKSVNVLGLDAPTIKEMVEIGLVNEDDLQWGQWNGKVPRFHELGGYDFHPLRMPPHEASPTNWKEYENIYKTDKLMVNLFDSSFSHTKQMWGYITATGVKMWGKPKEIEFISNRFTYDGITFFTDDNVTNISLIDSVKSKFKVAWLIEPYGVKPQPYKAVDDHHDKFDLVITHDNDLIKKYDNCRHIEFAECRVEHKDWGIHPKSKMVSLIAAEKRITEGHRFRYTVAEKLHQKHNFDLWGNAFDKYCENKTEALKDYHFAITIHNVIKDNFFTDGIIDCFALGTVPIFRGCPNIGEFFDEEGVICFETIEELDIILDSLTIEDYYDRMDSIKRNHEIAKKFKRPVEDQITGYVKSYFLQKEKNNE